jgi:hypothetical protein
VTSPRSVLRRAKSRVGVGQSLKFLTSRVRGLLLVYSVHK